MVKQGDIIKIDFDPQAGQEQAGYRPALVISNDTFNNRTGLAIVCPITNTDNSFPLHVKLDKRTTITGVILCEHIKSLDIVSRKYKVVDEVPKDVLEKVILIVNSEIE